MRAVIQRVSSARVTVDGAEVGAIGPGLLVLLGIGHGDDAAAVSWMAGKIARLRIFPDDQGKMNRSVLDCGAEALVVSQFTLLADTASGNRPAFTAAAPPDIAELRVAEVVASLAAILGRPVPTGRFRADMQVALVNDGPVTVILDGPRK